MIGLNKEKSERERLNALADYRILDTERDRDFDDIIRLASYVCRTPVAFISFVTDDRQWFKASKGLQITETPRRNSLCQFTIQGDDLLEIPDIKNDPFYSQVDLFGELKNLRFYTGAPLISPEGYRLGSLCVADFSPRELNEEQRDALAILSREVISHLEVARKNNQLKRNLHDYEEILSLFNNSSELHAILDDQGNIQLINHSVERLLGYKPEEVIGCNIWDFCQEGDRMRVMPKIEEALGQGETFFELETWVRTKDGGYKWFGWSDTKQEGRWLINGRDITAQKKAYEDLQMLSLVASKVNNGVVISNADNAAMWINAAFEEITGYSPEEIIGKRFGDLLKGADTDESVLLNARQLLSAKKSCGFELLCYKKDGTPVWLYIYSSVLLNVEGEVDKTIEIILDITERKKVEEELKTLSIAASKTSSGLLIRNHRNEVLWMNQALEDLLGYTLEELRGRPFGDMLTGAETDPEAFAYATAALEECKPYEIEIVLYRKDGTPVWLYLSNNPIVNDQGQMEKQIAIAVDITARKKTEEEVGLLSLVASKTANGVAIVDEDGLVDWVNSAYEAMTGYALEELKGKRVGDLLRGEGTCVEDLDNARKLIAEKKPFNLEILNYKKDGSQVWFSISSTPVIDKKGNLIKQVEIVSDITDRKLAELEMYRAKEEALQLSKAKETFLSVMSHEIRTPLNAILGLSRILQEENQSESQAESLNLLRFSAENLLSLINDVLDLAKIETGNLDLEQHALPVKELVAKTLSSIKFKDSEHPVVFISEIDHRVPDLVLGDETRLYQILINLLGNAAKFTEKGEVRLKLDLINESNESVLLRFEVADTGIGISKDKLETIFEPYKQATSDTTRKYGGTGLGLSITKKLIELHQSHIHVESEVGVGSRFFFEIDFKKVKPLVETKLSPDRKQLHGRVLVVDDNQINCFLARKVLNKWGLDVDLASNGEEAIEKVASEYFDLVLMDIHMPLLNGFDATRRIKEIHNGRFRHLPVIALTASILSGDLEEIQNAGMSGYVLKPFDPELLYKEISVFLNVDKGLS